MLNKLAYYQKMGEIAHQLEIIMEKSKNSEPVQTVDLPSTYTPKDLINFHGERLRILEVAVKCSETQIKEWLACAKKRPMTFETRTEIDLLEMGLK